MTTHLPECQPHIVVPLGRIVCICDRLRACEARVATERIVNTEYARGRSEGLDAARDAVTALPDWKFCDAVCGTERSVLAAIDALRGDPVT